jgi:hypothetical protein
LEGDDVDLNKMLEKLTLGDRIIGASAILLLLFSFFPWYDFTVSSGISGLGGGSATGGGRNGWSYFLFGIIPIFLALIMLAQIIIVRFTETKLPTLPISWAQVHVIAGGLATLLILLRVVLADSRGTGFGVIHVSANRKFGLFLALLAAIGLVVGAVLKMRDPAEAGGAEPGTPPAI